MFDPAHTLLIACTLTALAVALFWPVRGFLWRRLRVFRTTTRFLVVDALKHFHDFEYRRLPSTLQSLSGALGVSGNEAAVLLARLERRGLAS